MSSNPFDPGSAGGSPRGSAVRADEAPAVDMDVGLIFSRCLEVFQNNPGVILGAILLPLIPAVLINGADVVIDVSRELSEDEGVQVLLGLVSLILTALNWLVGVFFSLGQIRIFLGLVRGEDVDLNMLASGGPHYPGALAASILAGFMALLGLCFFIVPGIILGVGMQFVLYALVDQDLGPLEALSESWRLTDGYKLTVFIINMVVLIGGIVLFCVTFGFGLLLAIPILSVMQAVMYQSLLFHQGARA